MLLSKKEKKCIFFFEQQTEKRKKMIKISLLLLLAIVFVSSIVSGKSIFHGIQKRQQHGFGDWVPPTYNETVWMAFRNKTLLNPPISWSPNINWYTDLGNVNTTLPDGVCAVQYPDPKDRSKYYLRNFSSREAAIEAGAFVTHNHTCGMCSSTHDLSIYMQYPDLTAPARLCGFEGILSFNDSIECYQKSIGFTLPCAISWAQDARNSKNHCFEVCMIAWIEKQPLNIPPNSTTMSPCIQCDEDKSGPIFKLTAKRTRRDSGLASAINRPPDQIYHVTHYYY
jgi:hypothetical protein